MTKTVSQLLASQKQLAIHHELLASREFCRFLDDGIPSAVKDLLPMLVDIGALRNAQYACLAEFAQPVMDSEPWMRMLRQYHPGVNISLFLQGTELSADEYFRYSTFTEDQIAAIKSGMLTIGDLVRTLPAPLVAPILKRIRCD